MLWMNTKRKRRKQINNCCRFIDWMDIASGFSFYSSTMVSHQIEDNFLVLHGASRATVLFLLVSAFRALNWLNPTNSPENSKTKAKEKTRNEEKTHQRPIDLWTYRRFGNIKSSSQDISYNTKLYIHKYLWDCSVSTLSTVSTIGFAFIHYTNESFNIFVVLWWIGRVKNISFVMIVLCLLCMKTWSIYSIFGEFTCHVRLHC